MSSITDEVYKFGELVYRNLPALPPRKEVEAAIVTEIKEMFPQAGQIFVRLAGLSGVLAVSIGAYGTHVFAPSEADPERKRIFETGNRYHFFHTMALLAVPLTRRPYIVGPLLVTGTMIFSGSCYYHALTGDTRLRRFTPYGGVLLIVAWATMML